MGDSGFTRFFAEGLFPHAHAQCFDLIAFTSFSMSIVVEMDDSLNKALRRLDEEVSPGLAKRKSNNDDNFKKKKAKTPLVEQKEEERANAAAAEPKEGEKVTEDEPNEENNDHGSGQTHQEPWFRSRHPPGDHG